jgi:hypothetical protein
MTKPKYLFKPGDVIKHKLSNDKCIIGKIQEDVYDLGEEGKITNYSYSVTVDLTGSVLIDVDVAHVTMTKV